MGEANVRLAVDAQGVIGLELEVGIGNGLGAKVNATEGNFFRDAWIGVWVEFRVELAQIEIRRSTTTARFNGIDNGIRACACWWWGDGWLTVTV